mmetsp:Transcript_71466/g.220966  ORF Transcript_71466/g.220966 Transcript_71466/m.220966 type:complete len:309 (-) Transcript_71466:397-1323(-)
MQCALPVTGSSGTPSPGAKKRLTKSKASSPAPAALRTRGRSEPGAPPAHVTMTPRSIGWTRLRAPMSGASLAKASGATSSSQSGVAAGPRPRWSTSASARPTAAANSRRGAPSPAGPGGCAGKSMRTQGAARAQRRSPARRVWKVMGESPVARPVSQSACAAPRVACPQRSTSPPGVNHRISQACSSAAPPSAEPLLGSTKAVSLRLFSTATACIQSSSPPRWVNRTAAGLPASATGVKASTCTKSSWRFAERSSRMSNHCSEPWTTADGPRNSKPHCLYSPRRWACAISSMRFAEPQRSESLAMAST